MALIEVPTLSPRQLKLRPSYSRLETFGNCERRFLFDFLHPTPSTPAQKYGQRVHSQLERALEGETIPPQDLLHETKLGLLAWDELDVKLVETETWIRNVRELPFSGRVDVIAKDRETGDRLVVDWKTTKNLMNAKSQWEARRSLQLQIYCLATNCHRAVFVYLPPRGDYVIRDVTFTPAELDVAYRRLQGFYDAVRSRWLAAGAEPAPDGEGILQPEKLDLSVFSLAQADHLFCSEKWCPHWHRCLGDDHGDNS